MVANVFLFNTYTYSKLCEKKEFLQTLVLCYGLSYNIFVAPADLRLMTGLATLVATADRGKTRLTRIAHRSPARLLPMRAPRAEAAGAAVCAISSYGGGLLGGDSVALKVHAEAGEHPDHHKREYASASTLDALTHRCNCDRCNSHTRDSGVNQSVPPQT